MRMRQHCGSRGGKLRRMRTVHSMVQLLTVLVIVSFTGHMHLLHGRNVTNSICVLCLIIYMMWVLRVMPVLEMTTQEKKKTWVIICHSEFCWRVPYTGAFWSSPAILHSKVLSLCPVTASIHSVVGNTAPDSVCQQVSKALRHQDVSTRPFTSAEGNEHTLARGSRHPETQQWTPFIFPNAWEAADLFIGWLEASRSIWIG